MKTAKEALEATKKRKNEMNNELKLIPVIAAPSELTPDDLEKSYINPHQIARINYMQCNGNNYVQIRLADGKSLICFDEYNKNLIKYLEKKIIDLKDDLRKQNKILKDARIRKIKKEIARKKQEENECSSSSNGINGYGCGPFYDKKYNNQPGMSYENGHWYNNGCDQG